MTMIDSVNMYTNNGPGRQDRQAPVSHSSRLAELGESSAVRSFDRQRCPGLWSSCFGPFGRRKVEGPATLAGLAGVVAGAPRADCLAARGLAVAVAGRRWFIRGNDSVDDDATYRDGALRGLAARDSRRTGLGLSRSSFQGGCFEQLGLAESLAR
jgi:hypothetical protein